MTENVFTKLVGSRKFWLMLLDCLISTILFVVSTYFPNSEAIIKFMVVTWQPVIIAVIVSMTVENVEQIRASAATAEK